MRTFRSTFPHFPFLNFCCRITTIDHPFVQIFKGAAPGAKNASVSYTYTGSDEGFARDPYIVADNYWAHLQRKLLIRYIVRSSAKERPLRYNSTCAYLDRRHVVAINARSERCAWTQFQVARKPNLHGSRDLRPAMYRRAECSQ
jgi:hypothetical protein